MDNHEEEKEPRIAQSRAGEAGANLTDALAAETTLENVGKQMAEEFKRSGKDWPRVWMKKHARDRKILIEARRILIEQAEVANVELSGGASTPSA